MGRLQPKDGLAAAKRSTGPSQALHEEINQDGAELVDDEFHTEDEEDADAADDIAIDDDEDVEDDDENEAEDDALVGTISTSAPLLPEHLLKAQPLPEDTALEAIVLTRKQKRAQSAKDRKVKRVLYAKIRSDARGSGVLEAGAAAQVRRGLALSRPRVASGRVQKKSTRSSQPVQSGRQQILEKRKRDDSAREEGPLAEKKKSRRRAR